MIERAPFLYRCFTIAFWATALVGFITQELVPVGVISNYVKLLVDLILVAMALAAPRNKADNIALAVFLAISYVSTVMLNHHSVIVFVNGIRDYLGILVLPAVFRYFLQAPEVDKFREKIDRQLYIFLWVQPVCVIWQFLKYGAGDPVGGSFGLGYSGILSIDIYMISLYLMSKRIDPDNVMQGVRKNWQLVFLLFPTFLNETKISFILLFLYFILIFRFKLKDFVKIAFAIPLVAVLFYGVFLVYIDVTNQSADELTSKEFYINYLIGEDADEVIEVAQNFTDGTYDNLPDNEWVFDLPRLTRISLIPEVLDEGAGGGFAMGSGLGLMKGGMLKTKSAFHEKYDWMIDGSQTVLSKVTLEIGYVGMAFYLFYLFYLMHYRSNAPVWGRRMKTFLTALVIMLLFYNDPIRDPAFSLCYFYILYASCRYVSVRNKFGRKAFLLVPDSYRKETAPEDDIEVP